MSARAHLYILGWLALACLAIANPLSLIYLAFLTLGAGILFTVILTNGTFYYALMLPGILLKDDDIFRHRLSINGVILILTVPALAAAAAPAFSPAFSQCVAWTAFLLKSA